MASRKRMTFAEVRQQVAEDICIRLIIFNKRDLHPIIADIMNDYGLHYSPLTHLPCSDTHYCRDCNIVYESEGGDPDV